MSLIYNETWSSYTNYDKVDARNSWVRHSSFSDPAWANVYAGNAQGNNYNTIYYRPETPDSADQSVEAPIYAVDYGTETGHYCFLMARTSTSEITGYIAGRGDGYWKIRRRNNNVLTELAIAASPDYYHLSAKTARFEVRGTGATVNLKLYINDTLTLEYNDTATDRITSVGKVGIFFVSATNQLESFTANTLAASAHDIITVNVAQSNAVSESAIYQSSAGTITTAPLKNNAGTLLANETGATAYIHNMTTGELVVAKTGQTTNSAGVMTITDILIVSSTQYRLVVKLASAAEGLDKITAT